ncbi:hypothetical protein Bbelb_089000 [Branchiostoma belcheri]|nr:hypothetical protein Bbelb_089000 [Branchiostoma belcheri]
MASVQLNHEAWDSLGSVPAEKQDCLTLRYAERKTDDGVVLVNGDQAAEEGPAGETAAVATSSTVTPSGEDNLVCMTFVLPPRAIPEGRAGSSPCLPAGQPVAPPDARRKTPIPRSYFYQPTTHNPT